MAAPRKKIFRTTCTFFVCFLAIILFVCIVRALNLSEPHEEDLVTSANHGIAIKGDGKRIKRFQQALQFKTVSFSPEKISHDELKAFVQFIKKAFPNIHNNPRVQHEVVNNYSLLYKVHGSDTSLKPYLLCAHLDVVPTDGQDWDQPDFEGKIVDGHIYGRGALDDKHGVMGILEALEYLLERGHKFQRTFYVAFGHDEEVLGKQGATQIAKLFQSRGLEFEFILDEGLVVTESVLKQVQVSGSGAEAMAQIFESRGLSFEFIYDEGNVLLANSDSKVDGPIALIGTSEKGYLTLELSVEYKGGHSSMPDSEGAISILASAVTKLKENPQPSMLGYGPEIGTLLAIAPKMNFFNRLVVANIWLFKPVMSWVMSRNPVTNALIRTTTAVTMFHSGVKCNILPQSAKATVNHRVHPAQTLEQVIEYDRQVINDDRVKITVESGNDPHPMSPYDEKTFGYQIIKRSIKTIFKDAAIAPGVMPANTDMKFYLQFSKCIYRFRPSYLYPGDLSRIHGKNERISIKNYEQLMNFFAHVMVNADTPNLRPAHQHGEL